MVEERGGVREIASCCLLIVREGGWMKDRTRPNYIGLRRVMLLVRELECKLRLWKARRRRWMHQREPVPC